MVSPTWFSFAGAWLARAPHYLGLLTRYAIGALLRRWSANAPELRVFAAGAVKEIVIRVAPEFTKSTGIKVVPVYDTVGALRDRLLEGEKADWRCSATPRSTYLRTRT